VTSVYYFQVSIVSINKKKVMNFPKKCWYVVKEND